MRTALLTGLYTALLAAPAAACEIKLEGGWIRTAPPNAKVMAGFGTLRNPGHVESTLVKLSSPQFARVELHEMKTENGVMQMRPLEALKLEAGQTAALEPGGMHLMLYDPVAPLDAGASVELKLTLACDSEYPAKLIVADRAPVAPADTGSDDDHDHGTH